MAVAKQESARLRLNLFGGFEAKLVSGAAITLPTKKAQALLAFLAVPPGRTHPRDKLAALLWGERGEEQARDSLRHTLVELRKALPEHPPALVTEGRTLALAATAIETDVGLFERGVVAGTPRALEEAVQRYAGDFLDGFVLREPAFEEWVVGERERLRVVALGALRKVLDHQRNERALEPAIRTAVRILGLDPAQEEAHRSLMRLYVQQNRRSAALRQYQVCVSTLQRELGIEPEAETRELYQEILRRRDDPGRPRTVPSRPRPGSPPNARFGARSESISAETPLIGRAAELVTLRNALVETRSGRGRTVVVLGEAGVGKSRLSLELASEALRSSAVVLLGHAYISTKSLPFAPWVDSIRTWGVVQDIGALDGLSLPWRQELARLFPELADADVAPASDTGDGMRLFEAMAQLFTHLATRQPLVLVLEDLHWADATSLRLLAFVARRVQHSPMLIVATGREEELADAAALSEVLEELDRDRRLTTLHLAPLSREDTVALVHTLTGAVSEDAAVSPIADQVWTISEGNPFTIVETVRAATEGAPAAMGGVSLPQRVRQVITSRLERVGARSREVVAIAAVVGRAFDFALLQRATGLDPGDTAEAVEELVRRRVLHGVADGFDFTHDRIRTAVYDSLLGPRRQALHAAVARALEELHRPQPERIWSRLAYHYAEAGDRERAVSYLDRSAEHAARVYAHAEALAALEHALRLLEHRPPDPLREQTKLRLTLRRAQSLYFLGRFPESVEILERHRAHVEELDDPALSGSYHFWLGHMYNRLGDPERAGESARRAIEAASRSHETAIMGKAYGVLALESYWRGAPSPGIEHSRLAVKLLEETGDAWWLGMAHFYLGMNALLAGEFPMAVESAARTRTIGESIQDLRLCSYGAFLAGWVHTTRGECETAIQECEQSLKESTDLVSTCYASAFLGYACLEQGNLQRATQLLERAVQELERFGFRQFHGWFMTLLGEARRREGRLAEARELAQKGLAVSSVAQFRAAVAWAHQLAGRLGLDENAVTVAAGDLAEAERIFLEIGAPFERARVQLDRAVAHYRKGDRSATGRDFTSAFEAFTALDCPVYVERTRLLAEKLAIPIMTGSA
jgi:DNA-binding SARP family transcriptional activator/predicted ATPase